MSRPPRPAPRRRQPPGWLVGGVALVLVVLVGALAVVTSTAAAPPDETDTVTAAPQTVAPADVTMQDLLARAAPDADGNFDLRIAENELAGAIRNGMEGSSTPVDDLRVDVLEREGAGGRVGFDARLRDPDVPVSGEIDLNVVDGRLEPEIASARLGGLPLPGIAQGLLDDVLGEARVLSDELVARGIFIDDLDTTDAMVRISGQASG